MKFIRFFSPGIIVLFSSALVSGQINYPIFQKTDSLAVSDTGQIFLHVENLNYLKNNEYFNRIADGYTLFGYQLSPQLKYQPHPNIQFKAGIFLQKEFGINEYSRIAPLLTAKYQKKSFSFLFGNLEGNLKHRLIQPLYNFESIITDPLENGTQIKLDRKHLWLDWWIDWEKAIVKGSPFREEFVTGVSSVLKFNQEKAMQIAFPVQFLIAHKGGQLDIDPNPVESLFNLAAGGSVKRNFNLKWLNAIQLENYFVYYKDISGTKLQPFNEGLGYYSQLLFATDYIDINFQYWEGNGFIAPRGGKLYQSISEKYADYTKKHRQLVFLSLVYDKKLYKDLYVNIRFEPYYDIKKSLLEYSYAFYLSYKPDFFLKKIS